MAGLTGGQKGRARTPLSATIPLLQALRFRLVRTVSARQAQARVRRNLPGHLIQVPWHMNHLWPVQSTTDWPHTWGP